MLENMPMASLLTILKKNYVQYLEQNIIVDNVQTAEFPILLVLKKHDNITQKELADYLYYSEGLITRFIKRLEENDYIKRSVNPKNKREKIITITSKGIKLADEIDDHKNEWEKNIFGFLSEDQLLKFKNNIYKAIENSEKMI